MTLLITLIFIISYIFIVLEHPIKINKSAFALLGGVLCWAAYIMMVQDKTVVGNQLMEHLSDVSSILFFLMGAMTIVEIIDAHDGFEVITSKIKTKNSTRVLWIIGIITFFLSSVLDNLTTTIVMISLTRKIITDSKLRLYFAGIIVIAANAGGAWSPIGDVTTTMLWIGGQITTWNILKSTFLASFTCIILPLLLISPAIKGPIIEKTNKGSKMEYNAFERNLVFILGIGALIFVPVFKTLTDLPPYMGILFGLSILWIVTEILHRNKVVKEKERLTVMHALHRIDFSSILFFFGILMSIAALQSIGELKNIAQYLDVHIGNHSIIGIILGLLSAIIDNVPLVAAAMGMYDMSVLPPDHYFWELMAYTTGTGGSILIIGSAAGVAAMGMEKIEFFWYLKKISWIAFLGYFGGVFVYLLQHGLLF